MIYYNWKTIRNRCILWNVWEIWRFMRPPPHTHIHIQSYMIFHVGIIYSFSLTHMQYIYNTTKTRKLPSPPTYLPPGAKRYIIHKETLTIFNIIQNTLTPKKYHKYNIYRSLSSLHAYLSVCISIFVRLLLPVKS